MFYFPTNLTFTLTAGSDILAELPCPHSGLLNYECVMPWPNLPAAVDVDGMDHQVVESFKGQLHLRNVLNKVHNMLTRPSQGE